MCTCRKVVADSDRMCLQKEVHSQSMHTKYEISMPKEYKIKVKETKSLALIQCCLSVGCKYEVSTSKNSKVMAKVEIVYKKTCSESSLSNIWWQELNAPSFLLLPTKSLREKRENQLSTILYRRILYLG